MHYEQQVYAISMNQGSTWHIVDDSMETSVTPPDVIDEVHLSYPLLVQTSKGEVSIRHYHLASLTSNHYCRYLAWIL